MPLGPDPLRLALLIALTACCATGIGEIPLPEHPRPQVRRAEWINLNGTWSFAFDPQARGLQQGWHTSEAGPLADKIVVPFCWQSRASGIARTDYRGTAWYRRTFRVPAGWSKSPKRVWLHVDRADYELTAWVNGRKVGSHSGGYTPMAFDITDALVPGEANVLAIRVRDEQDPRQPTGLQDHLTPVGGIYGTVWLELAPRTRILAVGGGRVQIASGDRGVTYELLAEAEAIDTDRIRSWPRFTSGRTRRAQVKLDLPLKAAFQSAGWRPDAPELVPIRLTLRPIDGDGPADEVQTYIAPGDRPDRKPVNTRTREVFHVGDEPIWIAGAGWTARWPETLATPPSDAAIVRDLELARRVGLNALRVKGGIPTHRVVWHADRMGIALMVDLPSCQSIEFLPRDDAAEDWSGGILGVGPKWFWVESWDRMCLEFIRNYAGAPSIWWVTCWQRPLPFGDAGRRAKLLHWLHWRWHDLYSWGRFHAIEWHGNSGRCAQPSWWDLTLRTQRPRTARLDLQTQLATNRYRVFEEETVNHTDQRAETILVSTFGRAAWWTRDTEIASHLVELSGLVRSTPDTLAGMFWCDLTDTEFEKYGLVEYDRAEKVFDLGRLLPGWSVADLFEDVHLGIDGPLLRTVRAGSKIRLPGTLFIGHADPVAQPLKIEWSFTFCDGLGRIRNPPDKELIFAKASRLNRFAPLNFASPVIDVPDQGGLLLVSAQVVGTGAKTATVLEVVGAQAQPKPEQVALQWLPGEYVEATGKKVHSTARTGQQKLSLEGDGKVVYRLKLPANLPAGSPRSARLVFEAAACAGSGKIDARLPGYPWSRKWNLLHQEDYRVGLSGKALTHQRPAMGYPQTDATEWPSRLVIRCNGVEIARRELPDDWAGAAGVLSNRAGIDGGSYGTIVSADIDGKTLGRVLAAGRDRSLHLEIAFSRPADAPRGGGLCLYGDQMGSWPVRPTLVLSYDRPGEGLGKTLRGVADQAQSRRENPYVVQWRGVVAGEDLRKAWKQQARFVPISAEVRTFASGPGRSIDPPAGEMMLVDLTARARGVQGRAQAALRSYIRLPEARKVAVWTGATHPWKLTVVTPDGKQLKPLGLYHKWIGVLPEARMGVYDLPAGINEIRLWTQRTWPSRWQCSVKITDARGQAMDDVELGADPSGFQTRGGKR